MDYGNASQYTNKNSHGCDEFNQSDESKSDQYIEWPGSQQTCNQMNISNNYTYSDQGYPHSTPDGYTITYNQGTLFNNQGNTAFQDTSFPNNGATMGQIYGGNNYINEGIDCNYRNMDLIPPNNNFQHEFNTQSNFDSSTPGYFVNPFLTPGQLTNQISPSPH